MNLAVNYSPETLELYEQKKVDLDLVKLPAWPDLVAQCSGRYPAYVHFPLSVGTGMGPQDNGAKQPALWTKLEPLLEETSTQFINLHLNFSKRIYTNIPMESVEDQYVDRLTQNAVDDVQEAVEYWGADRVIIENDHDGSGNTLRITLLPKVYQRICEQTGCGFLLDLSHARMAARRIGMDEKKYIELLPLERLRELHITGLANLNEADLSRMQDRGAKDKQVKKLRGRLIDHMPMRLEDWSFFGWAMDQINIRSWAAPETVAFEYGGIGPFFGTFTDRTILAVQIPRLYQQVHDLAANLEG